MHQPFLHAGLLHKLTRSESSDNELVALLCLEKQPETVLEQEKGARGFTSPLAATPHLL